MSARRVLNLSELPEVGAVRVVLDGVPVAVVRDEEGHVHAIEGELAASVGTPAPAWTRRPRRR